MCGRGLIESITYIQRLDVNVLGSTLQLTAPQLPTQLYDTAGTIPPNTPSKSPSPSRTHGASTHVIQVWQQLLDDLERGLAVGADVDHAVDAAGSAAGRVRVAQGRGVTHTERRRPARDGNGSFTARW